MRVTDENKAEYEAVQDCKYQQAFPIMNIDALDVICTRGVDTKGLAAYRYAHLCEDCVGVGCKNYESIKNR